MEPNVTLFNNSTNMDSHSDGPFSLYPTYLKLLFLLPMGVVVTTPAMVVISIIVKNKPLRRNNNILIGNLLIANVSSMLLRWVVFSVLIILYLLDVPVDVDCRIVIMPILITSIATKVMFIPLSVNRFIAVAFALSYKRIMTTKRVIAFISSFWLLALIIPSASVTQPWSYTPSLGNCRPTQPNGISQLGLLGSLIISILTIAATSIYLRYRIIKSNRIFHQVKRNAVEEQKSILAGRLAEILQELVKPTLSVFILGGIDAMLNIIFIIGFVARPTFSSSVPEQMFAIEFILFPIQICQSASHALVYGIYNKEIRKKIYCNICNTSRSKVISLNGQNPCH